MVLVLIAVGAFLVLGGDDDGGDDDTASSTSTTASTSEPTSEPTSGEGTGSSVTTGPTASSTSTVSTPDPPVTPPTSSSALPEGFPEPPGATPSVTGGIEVPGTVEEVAAFYGENLPSAGFTVGSELDVGVGRSLAVTGGGLDGQLILVDIGLGTVTVIWTAS